MNQGPNQPPEPPAQSLQDVEQRLLALGRARSLGRLWTEYKRLRSTRPAPWTPVESEYVDCRFQEVARQITGATTPSQLLSYVRVVDELQETPAPAALMQLESGIFQPFGPPARMPTPVAPPPPPVSRPRAAAAAPAKPDQAPSRAPSRQLLLIGAGLGVLLLAVIAVVILAGGGEDGSTATSDQQATSSLQPTTVPQLAAGSGSPSATTQASASTVSTSTAETSTQAPPTAAPAAPTTSPALAAPTSAPTPDVASLIRTAVEGEYSQNVRAGNGSYVFSHLHQAAISFYGNQACQDFFSHIVADPTFGITVKSVSGPAPWTWQIYGDTVATIPDAYTLEVTLSQNGQTRSVSAHFAWDGVMLRVFSPCRPPPA